MIKEIQGLRKVTDCSMPSNEKERIHKAETNAYNQAINDVVELVKNCSIPNVVGRSEQLPLSFVKWYSGMEEQKILNAYKRWKKEKG
jgi:hypothetical protein